MVMIVQLYIYTLQTHFPFLSQNKAENIFYSFCTVIYAVLPLYHSYMWPWSTKPVLSRWGIFVAIAKNTLYGSKLSFFFYAKHH